MDGSQLATPARKNSISIRSPRLEMKQLVARVCDELFLFLQQQFAITMEHVWKRSMGHWRMTDRSCSQTQTPVNKGAAEFKSHQLFPIACASQTKLRCCRSRERD